MVSLMNGLSAMGQGTAQFASAAGLEQQKATLQQQGIALAENLHHANAMVEQQQAQEAAQKLETGREASEQTIANISGGYQLRGAQVSAGGMVAAAHEHALGEIGAAQIAANTDPAEVKLLRYLGVRPGGGSMAAVPAPSGGGVSGNTSADAGASAAPSGAPPAPGATSPTSDTNDTLIRKVLGMPPRGSEADVRMAIAGDVAHDPAFKDKAPGEQAAEVESRFAVASGKMTDPASRMEMAKAIATYQVPGLTNYALMKPGGPETMAEVMKINPDYQDSRFKELQDAMVKFGAGKEGDQVKYLNNAVQHLGIFDKAAQDLGNGNVTALNSMNNWFRANFGVSAPTTFNGLKQVVMTEVERAATGGIGATADRDRLMDAVKQANSPQQLMDMTTGFRALMVGQLNGLKTQYEDATHFTAGPYAFDNKLMPVTRQALQALNNPPDEGPSPAVAPAPTNNNYMTPEQMYGGSPARATASPRTPAPSQVPAWTDRSKPPPVGTQMFNDKGASVMWNGSAWQPVQ